MSKTQERRAEMLPGAMSIIGDMIVKKYPNEKIDKIYCRGMLVQFEKDKKPAVVRVIGSAGNFQIVELTEDELAEIIIA